MTATVPSTVSSLVAHDGWSRERLLAHQREQLRKVLVYAVATSPYYRAALGPDAAERPLEELPTLAKSTLVDRWDELVTDPRLRLAGVEAHAAGPAAAERHLDEFRVVCTSGSSGLRGMFVFDPREWETWFAAHLRLFGRIGIGPHTRLVAIGAPGSVHLTRQLFAGLAREGTPRLSVLTPLGEIVAALNAYRPDALIGYPSVGALLADEQLAGRLRIDLRVVGFGGEPITDDIRARVEAAWGIEPANFYATTEAPIIAASTLAYPDALELTEDLLIVEIVDAHDRPVPAGVPGSKVLLTSLINRALPLIRYELADRVRVAAATNPSGRPYRCIDSIDGRTADTLRLQAPGGGTLDVLPYRLCGPFAQTPGVRQYQLVWDGRQLDIRLVLAPTAAADTPQRLRSAVEDTLRAAGALPPPIQVHTTTALEREPGPAAKLKLIKSLAQ